MFSCIYGFCNIEKDSEGEFNLVHGFTNGVLVTSLANQPTMETVTDEADRRLLRAVVTCNNHVLMCLFPPIQATHYNLRPRAHNFKLPEKDNINFISRILFKR